MPESIAQRTAHLAIKSDADDLRTILESMRGDLAALATQFNQLRTDYNANETIATDTTATAVTLNTTA